MTRTYKTLLPLLFALLMASGCFKQEKIDKAATAPGSDQVPQVDTLKLPVDSNGLSKASIILKTAHGNIEFKLYPKEAPNTITRIVELVNKGFYDGLVFHRVISNFVAQTGDPTATGTGGSGKNLKAEFNSIQHIKGTVAMARALDPDSADSQFYIALTTLPHLDQKYTVFGQVVSDLSILDKIKQGDKILSMSFKEN